MFRRRKRSEKDFAAELQAHIEIEAERLRAEGVPDAQAAARRAFGNITAAEERFYESRRRLWAEHLAQDLRYGVRTLLRSPGFSAIAIGVIALGICANTTIFSVMNAMLLRPLPHPEPDRLVMIRDVFTDQRQGRVAGMPVTIGNFNDWVKSNRIFEQMGLASGTDPVTLTGVGEAARISSQSVSPEILLTLGAKAALGRIFLPEDLVQDRSELVLLSDSLWKNLFSADPQISGKQILIDGRALTVVGVMPPGFWVLPRGWARMQDRGGPDVWRMVRSNHPQFATNRTNRNLYAVARLMPEVGVEQAQAEMDTIAARLALEYPQTNKDWGVEVEPLQQALFGDYRSALYLLMGAAGFVLLIPCANVANLLLARAAARQKETAIRASLGAGKTRLIRQWLTESVLLSLAGGSLGAITAIWGIDLFAAVAPSRLASAVEISIDWRVLVFSLGLSILTGLIFGVAPALHASREDIIEALKEAPRGYAGLFKRGRMRGALMVSEVSLAIVLLAGAGLAIRGFVRLLSVDPGFQPDGLLTASVFPTGPKYLQLPAADQPDLKRVTPRVEQFYTEIVERLQALPQVRSAAFASSFPNRYLEFRTLEIEGRPMASKAAQPAAGFVEVHPNYFRAMGIPLRRGRFPDERDTAAAPWIVVINEAMARRYWPGADSARNAIGQKVRLHMERGINEDRPREIVGVTGDVRQNLPAEALPTMYVSYRQHPSEYPAGRANSHLRKTLLIRTSSDSDVAGAMRRVVAELDADQPVYDIMTANELLASSTAFDHWRFYARLLGLFGAIALLLAAAGIYGVMSYLVAQRYREIGIRMALGAERAWVVRMFVVQALKLTVAGIAVGMACVWALTRVAAVKLYGLGDPDSLTLGAVSLLLAGAAVLASYVPARRAVGQSPMMALRSE
jgi:putative ABC transport system permease protein